MRGTAIITRLFVLLLLPVACGPELDDRPWLVRSLEIVGWKADPAEARPGTPVTFQVAALDPAGVVDTTAAAWAFCHIPKPVDEDRVVPPDCLSLATPDAAGDPITLMLPIDACALYGPDVAQPAPGAPPTRPRDPDDSGGYFQPLAVGLGEARAVGLARVTCALPDASLQVARAFQAAYQPNQNPVLSAVIVSGAAADPLALSPAASVELQASWAADAIETYARYDRTMGAVVEEAETLSASWYVTGGALDRPTVTIWDPAVNTTTTTWRLPTTPGALRAVFVLRDSRGGSDFATVSAAIAAP